MFLLKAFTLFLVSANSIVVASGQLSRYVPALGQNKLQNLISDEKDHLH